MTEPFTEKRRYTRIFFSEQDNISCIISTPEEQEKFFPATVLNISEGGMQFNQKRQEYRGLQPQDTLVLRRLIGIHQLVSLADIPIQIKWVMDNEYLNHVVMGAAFTKLTDNQRKTIQSFVDTCLTLHQEEEKK
jgi:c-di-GMP-binding flagellar brake protein YcgR